MRRFIRFSSIGFALFSVMFWIVATGTIQVAKMLQPAGGPTMSHIAQAAPAVLYGVIFVWFCHWFARGVVKRMPTGTFD